MEHPRVWGLGHYGSLHAEAYFQCARVEGRLSALRALFRESSSSGRGRSDQSCRLRATMVYCGVYRAMRCCGFGFEEGPVRAPKLQ